MSGKGGKAAEPPSLEEKLAGIQKLFLKKSIALTKVLTKKLKLKQDAVHALVSALIEAQLAYDFQDSLDLPVVPDEKIGPVHELLTLADARVLNREEVEHLIAFLKAVPPADLTDKYLVPCKRVVHLQTLSLTMNDKLTYTQATSFKYGPGLKRIAELLAKAQGATFAKVWRPKAPASIFSKLYYRRGQCAKGWLTDALQGRINCDGQDTIDRVADFFRGILNAQRGAVEAVGATPLTDNPTGAEIASYSVKGLEDEEGRPLDRLRTWLPDLTPEDAELIGDESIVVYRVKECACCSEIEGMGEGSVMLVNLMLMRPVARYSGFMYKLPEQDLVCTMELQVSTPANFKRLAKALDAHDRQLLVDRFPLINKLQEVANGAQGKIVMPGVGKGGVVKGGDPEAGKHMMDLFYAVDLMHPQTTKCEAVVFEGTAPTAPEDFELHERDRSQPGSRWTVLWESKGPIFRIDAVTMRLAAKLAPLVKFSVIVSGVRDDDTVEHLVEEQLQKVPVSRGELQLVLDGTTYSGLMLGNLAGYKKILVELFEPERSFQWAELTDITIKALVEPLQEAAVVEDESAEAEADGECETEGSAAPAG